LLSILIPVYKYDCNTLVEQLYRQCEALNLTFEIIVADDASPDNKMNPGPVFQKEQVVFMPLTKNVGRAQIRNMLADNAAYERLIFIDGDSLVPSPDFISKYLSSVDKGQIVVGGTIYSASKPGDDRCLLRWKYGRSREVRSASERNARPFYSFQSNNFFAHREVFNHLRFDESIKDYGHEDTLFGVEAEARHIPVFHIDNPVIHEGLEPADVFILKTGVAVRNLAVLNAKGVFLHSRLEETADKLKSLKLAFLFDFFYALSKGMMIRNLNGRSPSLLLFDLYKLGIFLRPQKN